MVQKLQLIDSQEAARQLAVSMRTLQRWRSMCPVYGPKPIRVGYSVRYAQEEVTSFILHTRAENNKTKPAANANTNRK